MLYWNGIFFYNACLVLWDLLLLSIYINLCITIIFIGPTANLSMVSSTFFILELCPFNFLKKNNSYVSVKVLRFPFSESFFEFCSIVMSLDLPKNIPISEVFDIYAQGVLNAGEVWIQTLPSIVFLLWSYAPCID